IQLDLEGPHCLVRPGRAPPVRAGQHGSAAWERRRERRGEGATGKAAGVGCLDGTKAAPLPADPSVVETSGMPLETSKPVIASVGDYDLLVKIAEGGMGSAY